MKRDDKNKQTGLRTNRMFREDDNWFFKTREGDTVGPFPDELEASTQLEVYIRLAATSLLRVQSKSAPDPVVTRGAG